MSLFPNSLLQKKADGLVQLEAEDIEPNGEPAVESITEDTTQEIKEDLTGETATEDATDIVEETVDEPTVDEAPVETPESDTTVEEEIGDEAHTQEAATQVAEEPTQEEAEETSGEDKKPEEEIEEQEEATESLVPQVITNVFRNKHVGLEDHFVQSSRVAAAIAGVKSTVRQLLMIDAYKHIAQEHSLSAPVVATMRATPGFLDAAAKFPEPTLYNAVPEHKSSARFSVALEAFDEGEEDSREMLSGKAKSVVDEFEKSLSGIADRAELLKRRIEDAKKYLDESDSTDEILAIVHVRTLSNHAFDKTLGMLEKYLVQVNEFSTEELRSDPDKIKEEIDGLTDIVGDAGRVFGLTIGETGLDHCDKDGDYEPKEDTFSGHELAKSGMLFMLDKVWSLLDQLKALAEKKDDFVTALRSETTNLPETVKGDDGEYDLTDHTALISSYVCWVSKLVDETIMIASRLISVADKATDIEPAV